MLGLFLVSGWVSRRAIQGLRLLAIEEGNIFARVKGGIRVRLQDAAPAADPGPGGASGAGPGARGAWILWGRPAQRGAPCSWCSTPGRNGGAGPGCVNWRCAPATRSASWRRPGASPWSRSCSSFPIPRSTSAAWGIQRRDAATSSRSPASPPRMEPAPSAPGTPSARSTGSAPPSAACPGSAPSRASSPWACACSLDLRAWAPGPAFEKELERLSGAILQARLQKQEVFLRVHALEGLRELSGPTECWRALAWPRPREASREADLMDSNDSAAFAPPGLAIP